MGLFSSKPKPIHTVSYQYAYPQRYYESRSTYWDEQDYDDDYPVYPKPIQSSVKLNYGHQSSPISVINYQPQQPIKTNSVPNGTNVSNLKQISHNNQDDNSYSCLLRKFISLKENRYCSDIINFQLIILSIKPSWLKSQMAETDVDNNALGFIRKYFYFDKPKCCLLTYDSLDQYKSVYYPLIVWETFAQIFKEYQELFASKPVDSDLDDKENCLSTNNFNSFELINVKRVAIEKEKQFFYLLLENFPKEKHLIKNWIVGICNSTILEFVSETKIYLIGFVVNVSLKDSKEYITVKLVNCLPNQLNFLKDHLTIVPIFYLKPKLRLIETLNQMESYEKMFSKILIPNFACCQFHLRKSICTFNDYFSYNGFQQLAIIGSCNSQSLLPSEFKINLIQGPPGTGKTHTLVGIVKNILQNFHLKIMICAPSNGAIDEIARRLISVQDKIFRTRLLKFVRVGLLEKIHPDLHKFSLTEMVDDYDNRDRLKMERQFLLNADIILSTLNSSQGVSLDVLHDDLSKRCLIIDEASQCCEPESFLPLVYKSITKVIMIGDHLQLPATVISNKAQKLNYGRSLFERFVEYFSQTATKSNPLPIITLNRQYRMRKEICQFPSKKFYNGKLETAPNSGINKLLPLEPYFVFDLFNSKEEQFKQTSTMCNMIEATFVFRLLKKILFRINSEYVKSKQFDEIPKITIGIITFYRGQKAAIKEKLKNFPFKNLLKHVDVNTVDGFQGQERDIVILSCVRAFDSTQTGTIGFLRSQQRLNVALTRAKSALYICINAKSFTKSPLWMPLISDSKKRKCFTQLSSIKKLRSIDSIIFKDNKSQN